MNSKFIKYLNNFGWLFVEKLFRIGVSFVVSVYVVRYLGAERFGVLSYSQSLVYLFKAISGMGLKKISVRELVNNELVPRDVILGTSLYMKLFGGILCIILANMCGIIIDSGNRLWYLVFIISVGELFRPLEVVDYFFQSKVMSKYVVRVNFTTIVMLNIFKMLLVYSKAPLVYFAIAIALEYLLLAIGFIIIYIRQNLNLLSWQFDYKYAKSLFRDSWPLMFSGIVASIYMRIDQIMIKQLMSVREVGLYSIVVKLAESWNFIPVILSMTLSPAVFAAYKKDIKLFEKRLISMYSLYMWISILISVAMYILAPNVVVFLYGTEYAESITSLRIYSFSLISTFLGVATSQYLIATNLTMISFYRTFLGMVINIILNIVLIPIHGIEGAAIATLISYGIVIVVTFFYKDSRNQLKYIIRSIDFTNIIQK